MRRTVQSLALMLALSATVYAGDMQFPVTSTPPPPAMAVGEPTTAGEIQNPLTVGETAAEAVITLLSVVLRLF